MAINKPLQLFNITIVGVNAGANTEYNSIISQSYTAGVEVHF